MDGKIFAIKRRIANISFNEGSENSKARGNGGTEGSNKHLDAAYKTRHSSASRASNLSYASTRSSVKQKAMVAGLEAKREAMKKTQEAETLAAVANVEAEAELAKKLKTAQQKAELLKIEEQIAKAKAMEQVYKEKQESKNNKSVPNSSKGSTSSSSSRSSVTQRALIAGLEAESEAKRKTQEAELQVEQIKLETASLAAKAKEAIQKAELLKFDEKIAQAKAIELIYRQGDARGSAKCQSRSAQLSDDGTCFPKHCLAGSNVANSEEETTQAISKINQQESHLNPDSATVHKEQFAKIQLTQEAETATINSVTPGLAKHQSRSAKLSDYGTCCPKNCLANSNVVQRNTPEQSHSQKTSISVKNVPANSQSRLVQFSSNEKR